MNASKAVAPEGPVPALLAVLLVLAACSSSTVAPDGGAPDAASADAGSPDAASADASTRDTGAPDTGEPLQAALDARCRSFDRRAVVTVSDEGGPTRYLSAFFQDLPDPWVGAPALSDSACGFHQAWSGLCGGSDPCADGLACSHDGTCVPFPTPAAALSITVRGAAADQRIDRVPGGSFGGEITLPDDALSLSIDADGVRVEVPAMSVPAALLDAKGQLTGSYDSPQAVDLTWTAPADAAQVYSLTRINHHASGPTFTECVVPAAQGALHIDGAMLTPLAVITGLEFQSIQHVRFAAVDTPSGCVEIRFQRSLYVNLQ